MHVGKLMRAFVVGVILITLLSCWILIHHTSKKTSAKKQRAQKSILLSVTGTDLVKQTLPVEFESVYARTKLHSEGAKVKELQARVLLISRQSSINFHKSVTSVLEANRFEYQMVFAKDLFSINAFIDGDVGKFATVVFERVQIYLAMDKKLRNKLDAYCRDFEVGVVLFTEHEQKAVVDLEPFHLRIYLGVIGLKNVELNPSSSLLRLTKAGGVINGQLPGQKWSIFKSNHSTYEIVELALHQTILTTRNRGKKMRTIKVRQYTTVIHDRGLLDGIRRVYFGSSFQLWLHKLLFLDSLAALSGGKLARPLDRWILVDIDDIFVGKTGTRMTRKDVKVGVNF